MKKLTKSRYLHKLVQGNEVAVFHSLSPDPIFLDLETWERFDGFGPLAEIFSQKGLLVASSVRDEEAYQLACKRMEKTLNKTRILYLMLAQQCNFACNYCPIINLSREFGDRLLSVDDALTALRVWSGIVQAEYEDGDEYYIIFYGGEPLLNKEVFRAVLEEASRMTNDGRLPKTGVRFMLATNGSLFDQETITLCQKHNVLVGIGTDGPKASNDLTRVTESGECTSEATEGIIRHLVGRGISVNASVTITPRNLESSAHCSEYLTDLGVEKFGFNFLKGRALKETGISASEYYRSASQAIIANFRPGNAHFEYQMEKKVMAFNNPSFYPIDCTCYGTQLVVQPNGQVTNCPFYRNDMRHISNLGPDFQIRNTSAVELWRKRLPLYQPDHFLNSSIRLNGGGCAWSQCDQDLSPEFTDKGSQIFADEALKELIWQRRKEVKPWTDQD